MARCWDGDVGVFWFDSQEKKVVPIKQYTCWNGYVCACTYVGALDGSSGKGLGWGWGCGGF